MTSKTTRIKAPPKILQLHIELRGTKPKFWRRVLVPVNIMLQQLHDVIQAAFGWGMRTCTSSSRATASVMARPTPTSTNQTRSAAPARGSPPRCADRR